MWQSHDRESALIYDGCSVRFVDFLPHDPIIFFGQRTIARAFHVEVQDYGEPFPYFRSRARWVGDWLQSVSIIGLLHLGRWDGERFLLHTERPTIAATTIAELGTAARALLLVERSVPTEEELAAERGVPMPPADGCVPDYVERMMDPTTGCPPEPAPARELDSSATTPSPAEPAQSSQRR